MSRTLTSTTLMITENEKEVEFRIQDTDIRGNCLIIDTETGMHFIHLPRCHTESLFKVLEKHLYSDKSYSELEADKHRLEREIEELKEQLHCETYA